MPYYYDLLNQQTGELFYESYTPFDTIQDALVDAKKSLIIREAFWRVFTTPPDRSEYEEPQATSSISHEFESDVPELDWRMMLKIQSGIEDKVRLLERTLTPEEIDLVILEASGWDRGTDIGAEYLAEAFALVEDRSTHIYKSNPNIPTGTCYPDAWRYVMQHTEAVLAHGTAISLGKRLGHAWVELPDGTVWEPSSQAILPIEKFYGLVDPIVEDRYTAEEAAIMVARVGKHGPWSAEERMKHIGR